MSAHVQAARGRLIEARQIAEDLRDNAQLHRLAMNAVFVLEDCLFELEQTFGSDDEKDRAAHGR